MIQLGYPSETIKHPGHRALQADLETLLGRMTPEIVYTHNPADKHPTHLAVLINTLRALRAIPGAQRPRRVYGCETWRDLDWLEDHEKVLLDVSAHHDLAVKLAAVFESQIAGGKRYDLAIEGRRRANATFFDAHATDATTHLSFAMDLTPLIQDNAADDEVMRYVDARIGRFRQDVQEKLGNQLGLT